MCSQVHAVFTVGTILIANCWEATIKPASVEDQSKTDEKLPAEFVARIRDCFTPDSTLQDFLSVFQGNATRPGKCVWACIFKKTNVLRDNNTINLEVYEKWAEKFSGLPDVSREEGVFLCNDDEILDKCTDIADEDECEAAFKFLDCAQTACLESAETLNEEVNPSSNER